jgi:hypothetical protein
MVATYRRKKLCQLLLHHCVLFMACDILILKAGSLTKSLGVLVNFDLQQGWNLFATYQQLVFEVFVYLAVTVEPLSKRNGRVDCRYVWYFGSYFVQLRMAHLQRYLYCVVIATLRNLLRQLGNSCIDLH